MAVALVALFVALGGSSYAAISIGSGNIRTGAVNSRTIKNNDIRGKDVRNGTISSSDLGISSKPLQRYGPVALNINQAATLLTYGPFSVVGKCLIVNGDQTRFQAIIATTESGTSFGSGGDRSGALTPVTPETDRLIRQITAQPDKFAHTAGQSDGFAAVAPSSHAIEGTVHATANGQSHNCRAYGTYTRIR